jgi:hypothetical protein
MAACEDARKLKNAAQEAGPNVGRILVGQNKERPTRT